MPGFLPGVQQEHGGIIRHGAKMLFAYSAATVPKITVILRKATAAPISRCAGRTWVPTVCFAWPTAEIAVMGAEGAAEIVFRKEIDEAEDKAAKRAEMIEQYRDAFSTPYVAPAAGWWTTSSSRPTPAGTWRRRSSTCRPSANCGRQEARPDAALEE